MTKQSVSGNEATETVIIENTTMTTKTPPSTPVGETEPQQHQETQQTTEQENSRIEDEQFEKPLGTDSLLKKIVQVNFFVH